MGEHIDFLKECAKDINYGFIKWSEWRKDFQVGIPNLENAQLKGIQLLNYDFTKANLNGINFSDAKLIDCNFGDATLENANFEKANCSFSLFHKAILKGANFNNSELINTVMVNSNCSNAIFTNSSIVQNLSGGADFSGVDFSNSKIILSNLVECNLTQSKFINTFLSGSNISRSNLNDSIIKSSTIFGLSAWGVSTENSVHENLTITNDYDESIITVDDLEIASFIYLISNNKKISQAIDNITTKVVLILGRFTTKRLDILNHIKSVLKQIGFVPVLFDFEKPKQRDLTETIGLIGRMSRFVIADLTDAKSIPQELSELIPYSPSIKFFPIVEKGSSSYSMFEHFEKYPWVGKKFEYENKKDLTEYIETHKQPTTSGLNASGG